MFIISRKGGVHLVYNNYVFRSNLKRQGRDLNKIYWECIYNRSTKCRGRLKSIGDHLYATNETHNHEQDWSRLDTARKSGCLIFKKISKIGVKLGKHSPSINCDNELPPLLDPLIDSMMQKNVIR